MCAQPVAPTSMLSRNDTHAARLQPVLEKRNKSAVGVFDGSPAASNPQGSPSLDAQDGPEANAVELSSTASNSPQSSLKLHAVGAVEPGTTAQENGTASAYQPVVHDEPGQLQSREGIHAARNSVVGYAPGGVGGARRHVADEDTHVASLDWSLASASKERGGDGSAGDDRPSDMHGNSVNAHDAQGQLSRGPTTVVASSRSDASEGSSLRQEERHSGEDVNPVAATMEGFVGGSRASGTPRGDTMPRNGMPSRDQVDDRGSFPGDQGGPGRGAPTQIDSQGSLPGDQGGPARGAPIQNHDHGSSPADQGGLAQGVPTLTDGQGSLPEGQGGLVQVAPTQSHDQGSLPGDQGGLGRGVPAQNRARDEATTDLEQGTGKVLPAFGTSLDVHQEGPTAEGPLELHHGYRQIARPRTRSGSRAGTMDYGSTGGDRDGMKNSQPAEGKESGKAPRNDETGMEMATPRLLDEPTRSKVDGEGKAGDSSQDISAGSNPDKQKRDPIAASANDPKNAYVSQRDAVGGDSCSPLNRESATGVSPTAEAKLTEDLVSPFLEETVTSNGRNTTTAVPALTAANGEEEAAIAISSWKAGDFTAADQAAERAGSGDPRTTVPNYLSSSERDREEPEQVRLGLCSDEVDGGSALSGSALSGSVLNGSVLNGPALDGPDTNGPALSAAQVETQRANDPPASRRAVGQNNVLGSIAVAGRRMSIDSEKGGGHQQGAAIGSNAAKGRKSITARTREGGEILRRSSSSGVWRYDDLEQRQRQQPRDAASWTSLSVNPSSQGDVGKANLLAADGRVSPGFRVGEPRRKSHQQYRHESTRRVASRSSGVNSAKLPHGASDPEEYSEIGGRAAVTSDAGVPVAKTDPGIAVGGDLSAKEERGLAKVRKVSAENPGGEEGASFGIVGRGATLAAPFADANAAHTRHGGTSTVQRSPVAEGNSTAAAGENGRASATDEADAGLEHNNTGVEGGMMNAENRDEPAKSHRQVECDGGENDPVAARGGSGNRDRDELAIVSSGQDDTEVEAVAHAADREEMAVGVARRMSDRSGTQYGEAVAHGADREGMAVAVARRISDITGTQYGEALAEVRSALLRSDGGDELGEARRDAEKVRHLTGSLASGFMVAPTSCSSLYISRLKQGLEHSV